MGWASWKRSTWSQCVMYKDWKDWCAKPPLYLKVILMFINDQQEKHFPSPGESDFGRIIELIRFNKPLRSPSLRVNPAPPTEDNTSPGQKIKIRSTVCVLSNIFWGIFLLEPMGTKSWCPWEEFGKFLSSLSLGFPRNSWLVGQAQMLFKRRCWQLCLHLEK